MENFRIYGIIPFRVTEVRTQEKLSGDMICKMARLDIDIFKFILWIFICLTCFSFLSFFGDFDFCYLFTVKVYFMLLALKETISKRIKYFGTHYHSIWYYKTLVLKQVLHLLFKQLNSSTCTLRPRPGSYRHPNRPATCSFDHQNHPNLGICTT